MKPLILLQLMITRNRLRTLSILGEVKAAFFMLVGLLFLSGIYLCASRFMGYINQVPIVGPILLNKVLSMALLTSFSMVIFSSLITSFDTIFFSRDIPWLMVTPISLRRMFTFKALTTAFYSSWMVFLMLCPFLAAFARVKGFSAGLFVWAIGLVIPFLILASVLGMLFTLLLMRFIPSRRTRDILLLLGILFITGLLMLFRLLQPEKLVKPDGLEIVAQYLEYLNAPTAVYIPSWWLTAGIFSYCAGTARDMLLYSGLLYGSAVLMLFIVIGAAQRLYFEGWTESQIYHRRHSPLPDSYSRRSPCRALLEKDLRIFFRDATQWTQLLLLGALVMVYLFSIYKLPLDTIYLQNLITFLNVGLIGFIMSAVALRLIFPVVSLEGDTRWLLRAAPLSTGELLREKLVFSSVPVLGLGIFLVLMSNWLLKSDRFIFWISFSAVTSIGVGLSAMALGFGALFPRFDLPSVTQIESSAGGLFYIVTALFYLMLSLALWAWPVHNYYRKMLGASYLPWESFWWVAVGLLSITIFAVALPLRRGWKSMEELER